MPNTVPLLAGLALIIAAAKAGGWIANRLGQPAVLGELVIGLVLGPSALNVFGWPYFEAAHTLDSVRELGELGVIFLMFAAGLEIHLSDFAKAGRAAVLSGVLGVIVPIVLGAAVALPFGYTSTQAIFVGIVLAATSVSISAQTLIELGLIRSREGLTLLGAAVVDDVLAIAVLSAFVAIALGDGSGALGLIWIIVRMVLFLVSVFVLGVWLLPRLARWSAELPVSQSIMSFVVVSALAFAWASEALGGVAAITGAFVAGVALSRSSLKDEIQRGIHTLTYAFFVPVFLVGIGLTADARALSAGDVGLAAAVSAAAILSKLIGAAAGAKLDGMSWIESLRVGVGMVSRGEVGLIVAGVGLTAGVIAADAFTIAVVMVLVTTLVTPPLLRWVFSGKEDQHG